MSLAAARHRLDRLEEQARSRAAGPAADPAAFDWYAPSCPCPDNPPPGECTTHPRARAAQRPPEGDWWRVWVMQAGRGAGKSRSGAEWVIDAVRRGLARRPILVGPTSADVRDVMVQTILDVSPPWFRPAYYPSRRALCWPNGAAALLLSAEDPEQARGPNADLIWADEMGAWSRSWEAWRNLSLALRKGTTRAMVSTTPRRTEALLKILGQPTTAVTRSNTLENRRHLSEEFTGQVLALYSGTRFEAQEIRGELVETLEGAWFGAFDPAVHVSEAAAYDPARPVVVGIDAGTSRTTGCVILQTERIDEYRVKFLVVGEWLGVDVFSGAAAAAIAAHLAGTCPGGELLTAWIDPASSARTSIGVSARTEFERVFGRSLQPSPGFSVCDDLDQIAGLVERRDLVIAPGCKNLIAAFGSYMRAQSRGQWLDVPKADQSPHEDMIDALRYAVRGHWPEGRKLPPRFDYKHPWEIF